MDQQTSNLKKSFLWDEKYSHFRDYDKEVKFFDQIINEFSSVKKNSFIADLGCGTGTHTLKLSEMGYKTIGVDKDISMIKNALLRKKTKDSNFVCADMIDYNPRTKLNVLLLTYYVFQQYTMPEHQNYALSKFSKNLTEDGLIIFEFLNDQRNSDEFIENYNYQANLIYNSCTDILMSSRNRNISKEVKELNFNFNIEYNSIKFKLTDAYTLWRATYKKVKMMLEYSDFEIVFLTDNYSMKPFFDDYNSYKFIVVAQKKHK